MVFFNLAGTVENLFQFGVGGLGLRTHSGRLQVRNASNTGLGDLEANSLLLATPLGSRQTFSDTNVTVSPSTTLLAHTGNSLTALRTITLPSEAPSGYTLRVVDESGLPAWWFPLRIVPPTGTINGRAHFDLEFPYQGAWLTFDGSNWFASSSDISSVFLQQNQFFPRNAGAVANGVVVGGRGLDVAADIAGSGYQISGRHASPHLGGLIFSAGATNVNTDRAYIAGGGNLIFPDSTIRFLCVLRSLRLNDDTDSFNYSFGFRDAVTFGGALTPTDGVYFSYGDTNNPVAENWTATTANNNSRTRQDTGITVTSGETRLGIEISPTDARFYVNNTLAATVDSNIPRAVGRDSAVRAGFNRALGSSAVSDILLLSEIRYAVI